ncbi:6-pyruvoyl tetrahydropterin synthase [uncultured archaeon]|nr:6-pyruvoyl tetrahydropterin synthase [uncultured archaeon]
MITAKRYHDICAGHRVVGHEGKCRNLHGHNYRITFTCQADELDNVGRVVDFSVINSTLCQHLETEWDHRMLIWNEDPLLDRDEGACLQHLDPTVVIVPFNPTAENIAKHLVEVVGPMVLPPGVRLIRCEVEETRKCAAVYELSCCHGNCYVEGGGL